MSSQVFEKTITLFKLSFIFDVVLINVLQGIYLTFIPCFGIAILSSFPSMN